MLARAKARASIRDLSACRSRTLPVLQLGTRAAPLHFPPDRPFPWPIGAHCRSLVAQLEHFEIFFSRRGAFSCCGIMLAWSCVERGGERPRPQNVIPPADDM